MNRKTRSIIKYVEERHETLNIGTGDNVNNWEDLFNDDGELQEDFFTEVWNYLIVAYRSLLNFSMGKRKVAILK